MKIAISKPERKLEIYLHWLDHFKVNYDVLDYEKNKEDLSRLDECAGLILPGGVDVYPELYCDWDTPERKGTYIPERDGFELNLLEKALHNRIPVFGICRGLQVMNVFFRGNLIFDIEDIRKVNHRKIAHGVDRMHNIFVYKDTLLYDILNEDKAMVNSAHHQSADRLGEGLMINSKSEDGIVEGIEYADKSDKPFFLGVQWHPERLKDVNDPASKNLLDKFISECN